MNIFAKANLEDIRCFQTEVQKVMEYSQFFSNGINSLNNLSNYINEKQNIIKDNICKLDRSLEKVKIKLQELEDKISNLEYELSRVEGEIASKEGQLSVTPRYLSRTIDGETVEIPNPRYSELEFEISLLYTKRNEIQYKLYPLYEKKNRAESLQIKIESLSENLKNIEDSFNEMKLSSIQLKDNLDCLKTENRTNGIIANESLLKIVELIKAYVSKKLELESTIIYQNISEKPVEQVLNVDVNFNDTINETIVQEDQEPVGKEWLDDNDEVYRVGDELIKDGTFVKNGYTFTTDSEGRTISASGKLTINLDDKRNMEEKEKVGKGESKEGDDRGHLIAHQFNGSDKMENLVPQNFRINRGAYKNLEDDLRKHLDKGEEVIVTVLPYYNQFKNRPDGIFYSYTINGVSRIVLFPNEWEEV